MFIQTDSRIVNLKNVSNINLLPNSNRINFNLNYNIDINDKLISDYVYWNAVSKDSYLMNLIALNSNDYFIKNFINQVNNVGYINKNEISSIKFSEKKNRVIFNLSHPVTFTVFDGNSRITSEFVYSNCEDIKTYNTYTTEINEKLFGESNGN